MSPRLRAWMLAIRPATLTAAVAPVLVGSALAFRDGRFHAGPALGALLGAMLLQIGANLVNDVDDYRRGADTEERKGPTRVTQSGLLPAGRVLLAGWGALAGAALVGTYLVACGGWPILVLGLAAIASARAYTGGPWPLGYHGLGDLFVFLFFGVAAVAGTYYVQALAMTGTVWAATLPAGALATAILVVNNQRDVEEDRAAGKRTLVVRLGRAAGFAEYAGMLALAYLVCAILWIHGDISFWVLLPWLTLPQGIRLVQKLRSAGEGAEFNEALRETARLQILFCTLFAIGLAVG